MTPKLRMLLADLERVTAPELMPLDLADLSDLSNALFRVIGAVEDQLDERAPQLRTPEWFVGKH